MSMNGKISTGGPEERDFDKDLPKVRGVRSLLARTERLLVVTANGRHPAIQVDDVRLDVLKVHSQIHFRCLFGKLARWKSGI